MNPRSLLLALSLGANALLAFVVVNRSTHWVDFLSSGKTATAAASTPSAAKARSSAGIDKIDQHTWAELTTGELRDVAARLRAEGFPPGMQRAILMAMITEKFAARHKELAQLIAAQPWWASQTGIVGGAKAITLRQQIAREEKEMLDQLIGPEEGLTDYARARRPRQYGDLPPGKVSDLERLTADYNELMQEVRTNAQGLLLPEDREKITYLQNEMRADIAKLLTPDELLEYNLRSSPSAAQLRSQLIAFNPSEEEFRALYKQRAAFDALWPNPEGMAPEQRNQYFQARDKLTEQAKDALSPERFAEYQQKTDSAYVQTSQLLARLQLPDTKTTELVALQKDTQKRAQTIRGDRALPADQRDLQLGALGAEAAVRVSAIIGETNLPAYRQSAGNWLNQLRPPAPKK